MQVKNPARRDEDAVRLSAGNNGWMYDESGCEVRASSTFKALQRAKNPPTARSLSVQEARTSRPLGARNSDSASDLFHAEPVHRGGLAAILVAMSGLAALVTLAGCGSETEFHQFAGRTMGTEYAVTVSGESGCNGALSDLVVDELRSVNAQMSTWQPDSELSRFNRARAGEWVTASEDLAGGVTTA
ncbi:MAG: FAD:protein FMN transferase, partial [Gammaproteobacteria bacterium]|nr:FAD:protein FMN transferase [Gammaproteobacteria bacterium]